MDEGTPGCDSAKACRWQWTSVFWMFISRVKALYNPFHGVNSGRGARLHAFFLGGRSLDFVQCWLALLGQGRRRTAPDRLVGLVRVPELLIRFVPGAPEVRRPVVHPATALRDPCTHHCSTHLVPAHAAASMHHSGSVGLASLLTSHMDSAHGKRDRQFLP